MVEINTEDTQSGSEEKKKFDFEDFAGDLDSYFTKSISIQEMSKQQSLLKILGKEENKAGTAALFKGANDGRVVDARLAVLKEFQKILEAKDNYCTVDDKIKSEDPDQGTITLEELLGSDGVEAYKKAIKEENNSPNYLKAVLFKATKHYEGYKWDKKFIGWFGGPSASGKSFAAAAVIEESKPYMPLKSDDKSGNFVTSIDGGVDRETSQIRQLVIQLAYQKGYTGISNLHKNTKLDAKVKLQSMVEKVPELNMMIPATFTDEIFNKGALNKIAVGYNNKDTVQVFANVTGEKGREDIFQDTVKRLGNSRAWKTKNFKKAGDPVDITINNTDLEESKNYDPKVFKIGQATTEIAKAVYVATNKDPIVLEVVNDLMYVKKQGDEWIQCDKNDVSKTKLAHRDFIKWQSYCQSKKNQQLPLDKTLPEWLGEMSKSKQLAQAVANVVRAPKVKQTVDEKGNEKEPVKEELETPRVGGLRKRGHAFVNVEKIVEDAEKDMKAIVIDAPTSEYKEDFKDTGGDVEKDTKKELENIKNTDQTTKEKAAYRGDEEKSDQDMNILSEKIKRRAQALSTQVNKEETLKSPKDLLAKQDEQENITHKHVIFSDLKKTNIKLMDQPKGVGDIKNESKLKGNKELIKKDEEPTKQPKYAGMKLMEPKSVSDIKRESTQKNVGEPNQKEQESSKPKPKH